ncbi:capsular biosynthesis protein, partial [Staphylococcus aureus]|nr:capsular biosynthesis protein [Staphylococcus aureus]
MRILNIVSSNIVQDPRVLKQIETIKDVTDDYKIVGMNNSQATNKRLENL